MPLKSTRRWIMFGRFACLAFAAVALSGCIIEPAWPFRPYGYHHYR